MNPLKRLTASLMVIAAVAGACSSAAVTPVPPAPTQAPAAPTSVVLPATAVAPAAGSATVMAKTLGSQIILVAASNGMTVYTFSKDTAGNGQSACSGGCLAKWPALTVPAGATPTAGSGVSGALGTITRADNGTLQVTYNGLPLYFYSGDSAPGDTNGSYTNWNLVKP